MLPRCCQGCQGLLSSYNILLSLKALIEDALLPSLPSLDGSDNIFPGLIALVTGFFLSLAELQISCCLLSFPVSSICISDLSGCHLDLCPLFSCSPSFTRWKFWPQLMRVLPTRCFKLLSEHHLPFYVGLLAVLFAVLLPTPQSIT